MGALLAVLCHLYSGVAVKHCSIPWNTAHTVALLLHANAQLTKKYLTKVLQKSFRAIESGFVQTQKLDGFHLIHW